MKKWMGLVLGLLIGLSLVAPVSAAPPGLYSVDVVKLIDNNDTVLPTVQATCSTGDSVTGGGYLWLQGGGTGTGGLERLDIIAAQPAGFSWEITVRTDGTGGTQLLRARAICFG